jgi:hypothetical protein
MAKDEIDPLKSVFPDGMAGLSGFFRDIEPMFPKIGPFPTMPEIPDLGIRYAEIAAVAMDDSHQRTARHTEQMAEYSAAMAAHIAHLATLTEQSLRLAAQGREDSARVERFSRRMSVASLWVSIASLAAAAGSVAVAIVAINISGS